VLCKFFFTSSANSQFVGASRNRFQCGSGPLEVGEHPWRRSLSFMQHLSKDEASFCCCCCCCCCGSQQSRAYCKKRKEFALRLNFSTSWGANCIHSPSGKKQNKMTDIHSPHQNPQRRKYQDSRYPPAKHKPLLHKPTQPGDRMLLQPKSGKEFFGFSPKVQKHATKKKKELNQEKEKNGREFWFFFWGASLNTYLP